MIGNALSPSSWSMLGVFLGTIGVLLLFRYGMPFRVSFNGHDNVVSGPPKPAELAKDRRFKSLGYVGLTLIILGAGCQIWSSYLTR